MEVLALVALSGCVALLYVGWRALWKAASLATKPVPSDSKQRTLIVTLMSLCGGGLLVGGALLTVRVVCKLLTLL